jgi:hypothetical protein
MNEIILKKFHEINSLFWVLDLSKAKLALDEISEILKQSNDPFFHKLVKKYQRTYNDLDAQLNQRFFIFEGEQEHDRSTEQENGHFAHSDEYTSSLLIIKNKFELEARVVMSGSTTLQRKKESIMIPNPSMRVNAIQAEESETALVYTLSFSGDVPRFGEMTFTHSGLIIGRIFSSQYPVISEHSIGIYENITAVITGIAKEIYDAGNNDDRPTLS